MTSLLLGLICWNFTSECVSRLLRSPSVLRSPCRPLTPLFVIFRFALFFPIPRFPGDQRLKPVLAFPHINRTQSSSRGTPASNPLQVIDPGAPSRVSSFRFVFVSAVLHRFWYPIRYHIISNPPGHQFLDPTQHRARSRSTFSSGSLTKALL